MFCGDLHGNNPNLKVTWLPVDGWESGVHEIWVPLERPFLLGCFLVVRCQPKQDLGGGFKYFLFSPLLGEDSHFD